MNSILRNALWVSCLFLFCFASCEEVKEKEQRKEYWTNSNYPKYGIITMHVVPDSLHQDYVGLIRDVTQRDSIVKDTIRVDIILKSAMAMANQLYLRQTDGLRIYTGKYWKFDVPRQDFDQEQKAIYHEIKYGEPLAVTNKLVIPED